MALSTEDCGVDNV